MPAMIAKSIAAASARRTGGAASTAVDWARWPDAGAVSRAAIRQRQVERERASLVARPRFRLEARGIGRGATHRQRPPRRRRGRHHGRQVRRRFIEQRQVGRRLGPANHAIEVLENAREIGAFAGRARGGTRCGPGRRRLVPHVELAQRTARVPVADRKVGRGRRCRLRKLVPAIPAAVRRLETDVAAGRTLHCTVLMASADDGSDVASSVRWMSASSLSASARFGSSSETVAISAQGVTRLAVREEVARACQREVARARQRHRLGRLGRAQRRAGIRAPAAQIRDGAGEAGHERDRQNACRDQRRGAPRMTPRAARRGTDLSLDRNAAATARA